MDDSGYDYTALQRQRLGTNIQNFDMVTAVTQNAVNRKLSDIYKTEESIRYLKITKKNSKGEDVVKMQSSMNAPSVQFQLGAKKYSAVFFLAFKEGWFKWYDEFDEETKQTSVNNWTCAFNVDLAFQQLDIIDKNSRIAQTLQNAGLGEPGNYYVMQLLIDFTTADVINYRKDLSSMPGLTGNGLNQDQIAQITSAFGTLVNEYLIALRLSGDGNPHTLFNLPKWKKPEQLPAPSIQLTDIKFQCYPFQLDYEHPGVEGNGQNMLCYIEMTEKRRMPQDELNFSSNWVIPMEGVNPDGAVVLSRRAFIDNWFLKKLGDKINKSTYLSVAYARIENDGKSLRWDWTHEPIKGWDYNFTLKMNDGIAQWEFTHEYFLKPKYCGSSLEVGSSVNNVVQYVPGLRNGEAKLVISGTTNAHVVGSFDGGNRGARIWGRFSWAVSFVFAVKANKLEISMNVHMDEVRSGKEPLPGGDQGILYDPDPAEHVKSDLPQRDFDDVLKEMQTLFLRDWVYVFAGSDVFEFKRAVFNNNGDLLLDLYYK